MAPRLAYLLLLYVREVVACFFNRNCGACVRLSVCVRVDGVYVVHMKRLFL